MAGYLHEDMEVLESHVSYNGSVLSPHFHLAFRWKLSESDWDRCDALWDAVAGEGSDFCSVGAIVAMHESDRDTIQGVMDPDGTGQVISCPLMSSWDCFWASEVLMRGMKTRRIHPPPFAGDQRGFRGLFGGEKSGTGYGEIRFLPTLP